MGIHPQDIHSVQHLRSKSGHFVYRLQTGQGWRVLKGFDSTEALEPQVYALLESLGIATLPVHARTDRALLLEDLSHSEAWRAAGETDLTRAETGLAVAAWYRSLHEAGFRVLESSPALPPGLHAWVDELNTEALSAAGKKLGVDLESSWRFALERLEELKSRSRQCPQTFNYEDFDRENLALSVKPPLRAVIFDYDCFTLGAVYSDWRNVTSGLQGPARAAFAEGYGPVSEIESRLDRPLSTLHGLLTASRRENVPGWARPLFQEVRSGMLEEAIRAALD